MNTNNINCFIKILKRNSHNYKLINTQDDYEERISHLILPGIGTYSNVMEHLKTNGLDKVIITHINNKKKILAICVGMQVLTTIGFECSKMNGLDIFKNSQTVKLISDEILPHIGWNNLIFNDSIMNNCDFKSLFKNVNLDSDYYFVHSYNVTFDEESTTRDCVYSKCCYGSSIFIAMILTPTIIATQFHPEKSGKNGLKIIENFCKW